MMVSPRFYLLLVVLMFAIPADCMHYAGTLTPSECRAYLASGDMMKIVKAHFSCGRKWRSLSKKRISGREKHSLTANDAD